jgi:3-hydroxyisobutyrate dehydrogenase-like beta-hydroxyacid dehydrogenase
MTEIKRLGFVGLGLMGGGMVKKLIRSGYALTVFDIDKSKMEELKGHAAYAATSLKEVGEKSEVVLSSLPYPASVKKVYLEKGGVLEGVSPGTVIIDMSTVDPETSQSICKVAAEKGVNYLDAPVSGGPREAESGKLVIIVGGDRGTFDKCKGIFDTLGSTVHYAGPSGMGNVVKLVNGVMSMGNILIAAEAFVLGTKAGVDGQTLFNILRTSGGSSHHFVKRFPNVLVRNFEPGFTIDLAKKDVGLALDMAKSLSVPLPATSLVHQLYGAMSAMGDGKKDFVAIINLFESWTGVKAHG